MEVLVVGGGGREHAIIKKIKGLLVSPIALNIALLKL